MRILGHRQDAEDQLLSLQASLSDSDEERSRLERLLAAGVPVREHDDEEQHLALRLDAILKGGAEAVGCQAAALYLLDAGYCQW